MPTPTRFIVSTEADSTLQDFLASRMGTSRNRAKSLIDGKSVLVNRRRVWMARHVLHRGDTVEIAGKPSAPPSAPRFTVLFESPDFLIVDKPVGITANGPESVESLLRSSRGEPSLRAAHRLDRDTSGCLLMARNDDAFSRAIGIFREKAVGKFYRAIVAGRVAPGTMDITTPLDGQTAVTRIRTLSSNRDATYLDVTIQTGRTHQIRRHMAKIGHPVLGDKEHGVRHPVSDREMAVHRQMLHARELSFRDCATGQFVKGTAPLPHDFVSCLSHFKLQ